MDDLHHALGAGPPSGTCQVVLFVPSLDRTGEPIDQAHWQGEALAVLSTLFRGATSFPPGRGAWRDDDNDGELLFEDSQMVMSYADPDLLDRDDVVDALRDFLHRMGREANQGEIGVVIDGEYFGITDFDAQEGDQ